jgi:predicted transcriptional regulator
VRRILVEERNLAYTTVMTVLDRLEKRGGVTRRKQGRFFMYAPKVSRDVLRRLAVKELVDGFFDGSEETLLSYLNTPLHLRPSAPDQDEETGVGAATP